MQHLRKEWVSPEGAESVGVWVRDGPGLPIPDADSRYLGMVRDPQQVVRLVHGMERARTSRPGDELHLFQGWHRLYLRFTYLDGSQRTYSQNVGAIRTVLLTEPEPHDWGFVDEEFLRDVDTLFPRE